MAPFCLGEGKVMMSGYQFAFGDGQSCVKFLFKGWVINTSARYVGAAIAAFLMGVSVEFIRVGTSLGKRKARVDPFWVLLMMGGFVLQMVLAYWLMLLVMLYEVTFFICVVMGLAVGFTFVSLKLGPNLPSHAMTPCCRSPTCNEKDYESSKEI